MLRTITATRYVTPLREGGSLPAIVEADDDGLYVVKFRGAGQGPKALAAEIVAGEIGRALGLPVPELVLVELDPQLAGAEPDPEIRELLAASAGLNVGMDFLPGAMPYSPAQPPDAELSADVVWFDALVLNVDRTPRNPNLLRWHGRTWLIDHGAALYIHHGGGDVLHRAGAPFAAVRDHVLLPYAGSLPAADARLGGLLDRGALTAIAALVPPEWTGDAPYAEHLAARLEPPRAWVQAAEAARVELTAAPRRARDEEADRGRA
ncbi:MAG: hypothetical protein QOK21_3477 [Solirubrobacteraceae bacterium]|nr:hypothetical protein [Solirubrobacteraceae bacterium]